jgi:hypothetical protein
MNRESLDPGEMPGYLVPPTSVVDLLGCGRLERMSLGTGILRRRVERHAPAFRRLFGLPRQGLVRQRAK